MIWNGSRGWFGAGVAACLSLIGSATLLSACADRGKPAHLDIAGTPTPLQEEHDEWMRQQRLVRLKRITTAGVETQSEISAYDAYGAVTGTNSPCGVAHKYVNTGKLCLIKTTTSTYRGTCATDARCWRWPPLSRMRWS